MVAPDRVNTKILYTPPKTYMKPKNYIVVGWCFSFSSCVYFQVPAVSFRGCSPFIFFLPELFHTVDGSEILHHLGCKKKAGKQWDKTTISAGSFIPLSTLFYPVKNPVEVGSWNPIIYKVFIPSTRSSQPSTRSSQPDRSWTTGALPCALESHWLEPMGWKRMDKMSPL